jgi:hypothetical protein
MAIRASVDFVERIVNTLGERIIVEKWEAFIHLLVTSGGWHKSLDCTLSITSDCKRALVRNRQYLQRRLLIDSSGQDLNQLVCGV